MKKVSLYILCGLPFSGKTTLAGELMSRLGISRIAIDDINGERGIWDDETGLSPEEWTNTYQEAYRRIEALLSQGKSVILFHRGNVPTRDGISNQITGIIVTSF